MIGRRLAGVCDVESIQGQVWLVRYQASSRLPRHVLQRHKSVLTSSGLGFSIVRCVSVRYQVDSCSGATQHRTAFALSSLSR